MKNLKCITAAGKDAAPGELLKAGITALAKITTFYKRGRTKEIAISIVRFPLSSTDNRSSSKIFIKNLSVDFALASRPQT